MQQVSAGGGTQGGATGYCEEDDLPSCAYAHAHHRLHGIPFLVHGEFSFLSNEFIVSVFCELCNLSK